jgi:4-diphosphocytidyl-2-C-methyl-D-erythritol kinase
MPTRVRSYSKINLGLAIGAPRPDGFHSLATLYQTLALHDLITVSASLSRETSIKLTSNDLRVPTDSRNTVWKMVDIVLDRLGISAGVDVFIQKNLPIQGGMGAGSANAAAALIGLIKELDLDLPIAVRLDLAAEVGSDVPLFLIGGSVLGSDRGQCVTAVPDITLGRETVIPCVVALPGIGVSTPLAFREWDRRFYNANSPDPNSPDSRDPPIRDTLYELSRTFATVFRKETNSKSGASGIFPDPGSEFQSQSRPEKLHGLPREQLHGSLNVGDNAPDTSGLESDLAENSLLALVRTGIENDFETVVFPQYPLLRDIKRLLMGSSATETGSSAVYAALSGSGSALFGLYRTQTDATEAQQRLQQNGVKAIVTATMPRSLYWTNMFAE